MLTKEEIYKAACLKNKVYPTSNERHTAYEAMTIYADQQNSSLIKEVEELKRENEKLKVRLEHMTREFKNSSDLNISLKRNIEFYSSQLQQKATEIKELKEALEKAENEIGRLQKQLDSAESYIQDMDKSNDAQF